jgi:RNA polymerase sigma-70 factor, ECF subfamily
MNTLRTMSAPELEDLVRYLRRFAGARLREAEAVDDLVQETLSAALASQQDFAGRSTLRTWMTSILRHKIADHVRARIRERAHRGEDAFDGDDEAGFSAQAVATLWDDAAAGDASAAAERSELLRDLAAGLGTLPKKQAAAFLLCEVQGRDTVEACRQLKVSANNLWIMVHRAKRALRGHLAGHYLPAMASGGGASAAIL